jgi:hypothetical protein
MGQPGGDLDFPEEATGADGLSQVGLENLYGYVAVVPEILGEVHRRHPATAKHARDRVALRKGRLEAIEQIGH